MTPAIDICRVRATVEQNRLALYRAAPPLQPFMQDESLRILVRAANRVGKTRAAAAKLSLLLASSPPTARYRAVGVNYQQSVGVIGKYLSDFIPRHLLASGCHYTQTNGWSHQLVQMRNGASCEIRSSEQAAISHAGSDLDGIWLDEFCPEEILGESIARVMSKRGWVWQTGTPVGRPVEYFRTIVEAPETEWKQYVVPFSHTACPWYSKAQVDSWIEEQRAFPDTYGQRINGDWESPTSDRTFTGFDSNCIFKGDVETLIGDESYTLGIGIDHGEGVGKQVAIIALWTADQVIVIDEIVNEKATTPDEDAKAILKRLSQWGWRLDEVQVMRGDVNSGGKMAGGHKVNELLSAALHRQAGFKRQCVEVQSADKGKGSVEYGERLLNNALLRGTLLVHDRCSTLIKSLRHYTGEEDLKHPLDALRYLIVPVLSDRTGTTPRHSRLRITR